MSADENFPNVRLKNLNLNENTVSYGKINESRLKIRWAARKGENTNWLEYNPADLEVSLNDIPLLINKLVLTIEPTSLPQAEITFTLSELDIDADTLAALNTFLVKEDS